MGELAVDAAERDEELERPGLGEDLRVAATADGGANGQRDGKLSERCLVDLDVLIEGRLAASGNLFDVIVHRELAGGGGHEDRPVVGDDLLDRTGAVVGVDEGPAEECLGCVLERRVG